MWIHLKFTADFYGYFVSQIHYIFGSFGFLLIADPHKTVLEMKELSLHLKNHLFSRDRFKLQRAA